MRKKIGLVSFYCPERGVESSNNGDYVTFGLSLLVNRIKAADKDMQLEFFIADEKSAKEADFLFVTLYWWKDIFLLPRFLLNARVNPKNKKPTIIVGGISALNPAIISGFCHYVFCGDVDDVITEIYKGIISGDVNSIPGMFNTETKTPVEMQVAQVLEPWNHCENRESKITRLEIARGCKHHCPFCVIGNYKKYIELPTEQCIAMIKQCPTKNIAVFAPDRGVHSGFIEIENAIMESKLHNMGSDIRLDTMLKHNVASQLRFGIEGYSERLRKYIGKPWSNDRLITLLLHAINDIKKPNGNAHNSFTAYLISGLPGVQKEDVVEFWQTLKQLDEKINRKITLFLSQSNFVGYYFTPFQYAPHDLRRDYSFEYGHKANLKLKKDKQFSNIIIAHRGGSTYPIRRLMQIMTVRGDERCGKIVFNIAANKKYHALSTSKSADSVEILLALLKREGITENYICGEKNINFVFPHEACVKTELIYDKSKYYKQFRNYMDCVGG